MSWPKVLLSDRGSPLVVEEMVKMVRLWIDDVGEEDGNQIHERSLSSASGQRL